MTPEQLQLLRRLALNEPQAVSDVMGGNPDELGRLDQRAAALVRIAALLSVDSDAAMFQWTVEDGIAAGVDDSDVFHTLIAVAPIIGMARLTSALPHLLHALGLEIIDS